jgi:hypothetical protein
LYTDYLKFKYRYYWVGCGSGNTLDLYLGGAEFESRLRQQLPRLKFSQALPAVLVTVFLFLFEALSLWIVIFWYQY